MSDEQTTEYTGPRDGLLSTAEAFMEREQQRNAPVEPAEGAGQAPDATPGGLPPGSAPHGEQDPNPDLNGNQPHGDDDEPPDMAAEGAGDGEDPAASAGDIEDVEIDPEALVQVTLPGGELADVPFSEVLRSYSREADYTRKMQDLADQRRQLEAQQATVNVQSDAEVSRLREQADNLERLTQMYQPNPQHMAELQQTDPGEWSRQMLLRQQQEQMIQAARAEVAAQEQRAIQARVPQERARLETMSPKWVDDFDGYYAQVGAYATDPQGGGLSAGLWNSLVDAHQIQMIADSMEYRRGEKVAHDTRKAVRRTMAKTRKLRPTAVEPKQPGDSQREEYDHAMATQRERGDVASTANAFLALDKFGRRPPGG